MRFLALSPFPVASGFPFLNTNCLESPTIYIPPNTESVIISALCSREAGRLRRVRSSPRHIALLLLGLPRGPPRWYSAEVSAFFAAKSIFVQ